MTETRLIIESAGPLTTLQDAGRPGFMRFGVPASGPIDRRAFAAAHAALGNPAGSTLIELSAGGIALRAGDVPVTFALTGGDFTASIDGVPLGSWLTATLPAHARLAIRAGTANWACLAFAGTLHARPWLGSTATHALAALGGGHVTAGQTLALTVAAARHTGPLPPPPIATGPIRTVIGPQQRFFGPSAPAALAASPWRIGTAFDRMGVVLDGPALVPTSLAMLSEPLVRGTLQVNGSGTTTALLADHQSTGGYPRIATIITADIDRLAQMPPGTPVRFTVVTPAQAAAAARAHSAETAVWLAAIANPSSLEDRLNTANLITGAIDACDP